MEKTQGWMFLQGRTESPVSPEGDSDHPETQETQECIILILILISTPNEETWVE